MLASNWKKYQKVAGRRGKGIKILNPKFQNLNHELEQAFTSQTQYYLDLEDESEDNKLQRNDTNIRRFIEARSENDIIDVQFARQLQQLFLNQLRMSIIRFVLICCLLLYQN